MSRPQRGRAFLAFQKRFRGNRFLLIDGLMRELLQSKPEISVLDCGGTTEYWFPLAEDLRPRVHITCLNFEGENTEYVNKPKGSRIDVVAGDACNMPQYAAGQFDLVHSNSVIEHVGSYANMKRFADETRRVGRAYYVQTPNFWFPMEPHYVVPFYHWLPDSARLRMLTQRGVGSAGATEFGTALSQIDYVRMISKWTMRNLFPDAQVSSERFMLLPKSHIAIRRAA